MNVATACLYLAGLECMNLQRLCVLVIAQSLLLQPDVWTQNLSLDILAIGTNVTGIQMSFGCK